MNTKKKQDEKGKPITGVKMEAILNSVWDEKANALRIIIVKEPKENPNE